MENMVTLFRAVEEHCPLFPEKGTLDVELWDRVGAKFRELVPTGNYVPVTVWGDWALVCAVLMTYQSHHPLQLPQFSESGNPPPLPQPSSPARPSLPDQPLPSPTPSPPEDIEDSISNSSDFGLTSPPDDLISFHEQPVLVAPTAPTWTAQDCIYANSSLFKPLQPLPPEPSNGSGTKLQFTCNSAGPPPSTTAPHPPVISVPQLVTLPSTQPASLYPSSHVDTPATLVAQDWAIITSMLLPLLLLWCPFLTLSYWSNLLSLSFPYLHIIFLSLLCQLCLMCLLLKFPCNAYYAKTNKWIRGVGLSVHAGTLQCSRGTSASIGAAQSYLFKRIQGCLYSVWSYFSIC
eukprot:XP_016872515.1 transmembrane protein 108-like [Homo sapiens]